MLLFFRVDGLPYETLKQTDSVCFSSDTSGGDSFGLVPHPKDLLLATAAAGGEELLVAVLAVNGAALLHKAHLGQRAAAVSAVKLLRVP